MRPESLELKADSPETVEPDVATVAALRFQELFQQNPEDRQALDDSFAEIVNLTYPALFRELSFRGLTAEASQDILQITYTKAFQSLAQGKFEGRSKVGTWLYRSLFNNRINYVSAVKRRSHYELSAEDLQNFEFADSGIDVESMVIDSVIGKDIEDSINDLLDQLNISSRDQKVWSLRNEGLHFAEIATLLGITVVASRVCYHRVRKKLADHYTT